MKRIDVGDVVYHVINRSNGRLTLFEKSQDYVAFEKVLKEAKSDVLDMRVIAYCLMPNHFHLILYPRSDGDLSRFMHWVTSTHAKRWHEAHDSVGTGHVYQNKFKSFPIESDEYFVTACRYVERNARRANFVERAEEWRWSSLWRRENGNIDQRNLLAEWPVDKPDNYLEWVNQPLTEDEREALRASVKNSTGFGSENWKKQWKVSTKL